MCRLSWIQYWRFDRSRTNCKLFIWIIRVYPKSTLQMVRNEWNISI